MKKVLNFGGLLLLGAISTKQTRKEFVLLFESRLEIKGDVIEMVKV